VRSSKTPGKTTGGKDGKLGPYLAHLPNASEVLTTGGEVEIRIPIEGGGDRVAIGRPARFLIAFLSAYSKGLAAGTLHHKQIPLAHRAGALLAAFAEKGIEAMVDEACGVLVRAPQGGLPAEIATTDELRGIVRDEIAAALQRADLRGMIREELHSSAERVAHAGVLERPAVAHHQGDREEGPRRPEDRAEKTPRRHDAARGRGSRRRRAERAPATAAGGWRSAFACGRQTRRGEPGAAATSSSRGTGPRGR
jgi:hypothetical protein